MALNEACQLWIEQEIDEGHEKGETNYSIGKRVSEEIEKYFEIKIKPRTIERRALRRQKSETNVSNFSPENPTNVGELLGAIVDDIDFLVDDPTSDYTHRTAFTGENEWYTPPEYIKSVRSVMGNIDLDPATSEAAQKIIQAKNYYTKEVNGLEQEWEGRVWLNPPYSQPLIMQFVEKLVEEIQTGNVFEAIMLTHNHTDTKWFHLGESLCELICFTKGRINYIGVNGEVAAPTQGAAFFYFGLNSKKFRKEFENYGFIR